jgi:hypothetical protein
MLADLASLTAFATIGSFLHEHAARAPLEQQIAFGLFAQRYCRALGLNVVKLPGEPPRLPTTALEHVRNSRYAHWSEAPSTTITQGVAELCADLLGEAAEAGPFTFQEVEQRCIQHGHLARLFRSGDSPASRMARLGLILHRHAKQRLPNDCVLHIRNGAKRRRLYTINRPSPLTSNS